MNVAKVIGLFIALGIASYSFVWLSIKLREEITTEFTLKEVK